MTYQEIADILEFESCTEEENDIVSYYFRTDDVAVAKTLFRKFCKMDLQDYVELRTQEDNAEASGISFCIDYNVHSEKVSSSYIIPQVMVSDIIMELFPVPINMTDKLMHLLLEKNQ